MESYRPILCLPLTWKFLTGIISEHFYSFLEEEKILPKEQKGCKRNSRGTKDQVLVDKAEQCLKTAKGEVQTWRWLG